MAVKTANLELHDALVRHQIYLLRYSGSIRNRILNILDKTQEDISDKIRSRLLNSKGLTTTAEFRRMQALIDSIQRIRSEAWDKSTKALKEDVVALARQEPQALDDIVKVVLPVQIDTVLPTASLMKTIAFSQPFQGRVLGEWASSMESEELRRISNAIQLGMTAGEDMATIARRVVGSAQLGGTDGVLNMTRSQVESITRTAVMHVSNRARDAYFEDNSDIITKEYFVATLDSRTTPICRANDGKVFALGQGPKPPLHFRCRSLRIAAIDGTLAGDRPAKPYVESQLVKEYADQNGLGSISSRADLPRGTKGDYDKYAAGRIKDLVGPIPASTTYQQWLKGQSTGFQNDILGVTKAKLFRDGDLALDKFVNVNGDELTLAQLAIKEKQAFIDAGLDPGDF